MQADGKTQVVLPPLFIHCTIIDDGGQSFKKFGNDYHVVNGHVRDTSM